MPAAHLEDRRVEVAGSEVAEGFLRIGLPKVEDEDVRALALLPFRPVPEEKGVREVGLELVLFARFGAVPVARGVGAAVGKDVRGKDEKPPVSRERGTLDAAGKDGLLFRLAALERQEEDLRVARARRDERERPAVGREERMLVAGAPEDVSGRAFFPSASIRQRATVFFFVAQSFVATLYTTVFPSGEIAGSPTPLTR